MIRTIDTLLNKVTMYKLVAYGLAGLALIGLLFTFGGRFSFTPVQLVLSFVLLMVSAYSVNWLFSRVWNVPTNHETWFISAMIIFLIVQPAHDLGSALSLVLAGGLSSASKFLVAYRGKHIFNPAAFAAAFVGVLALTPTTWWVGSSMLWPFTLLLGLAIARKIHRFPLYLTFISVVILLQLLQFTFDGQPLMASLMSAIAASPLLFLGGVMLTEPATMPPRRWEQIVFACIVAAFYVGAWKIGPLIIYPEVALLLGNIYSYIVSPKYRVMLRLAQVQKISEQVYNYVFTPQSPIRFLAGQYMEWTLANVPYNTRGNRRTFTIASSPTEDTIQVGVKYYEPSSAYKTVFRRLQIGDTIYASQIAGSFILRGNEHRKLAFIAGGVGITPFRSMIKQLIDENRHVDITLLYSASTADELAYMDIFNQAAAIGVTFIPIVPRSSNSLDAEKLRLNERVISHFVPDFRERTFYVSGPLGMVESVSHALHTMHVKRTNIRTDYFSGY